jgi:hypothetical protein
MTAEDLQAIRGLLTEFKTEPRAEFRQESLPSSSG